VRFIIFTHSLVSDWNHGNAHFLRGICTELNLRGHQLAVFEPENGWSRENLLQQEGATAIAEFHERYPGLTSILYNDETLDLDSVLNNADVVLVHEWNTRELISRIGQHRATHDYKLLFHDTHHRSLSDKEGVAKFDLQHYDGVLAYGEVIRKAYVRNGWANNAWTWHEAADTRVFHPIACEKEGDLVWIGNWGDDERACEPPYMESGIRSKFWRNSLTRALNTKAGWQTTVCLKCLPATGLPCMYLAGPMWTLFRAFRLYVHSKRWPAASRFSRRPGTMRSTYFIRE
jgi:spore maturation protein CgeB